ncbi:endo-1,4-beta-glucanase [Legionella cincinnatiensis]|uniref:Endo-1,4-beta-glucanase n=2 Tax=Legionella cincinnatiensis TaxID=28085 RepID=A0A378IXE5_9GAMM|nr:M42 family metallopeptidase [Legionella cincinnatiensis]KTC83264.1 endo-1,4-beta-glucanase [Legionella cincinnatiensis]STX36674.1 endo-1,4-beta-glucanase [Legionella cincinnatiensis]
MKKLNAVLMGLMMMGSFGVIADQNSLAKLTDLAGASGFEKSVRDVVKQQWQQSMSRVTVDGMGNLIGLYKDNSKGPNVLLMAHMDEVGYMVESITPDGFLKIIPLGGIPASVIFAQRWTVSTPNGPILAYSGMDSTHLIEETKKNKLPAVNAVFLDIGAETKEQAETQFNVRPGLQVTPASQFSPLSENRYLAKALDDRLGLALIGDVLESLKNQQQPNQLFTAATVQEEVGLRGASTVFNSTHPDVTINVEVGIADDYPALIAARKGKIALGKGPTLFVYDRSMIPHQELLSWILELAKKNNIPIQLESEIGYGQDGSKVQGSGSGVPSINIGVPIRYAHQQAGVFDKRDYDQAVKLISLIVTHLNQNVVDQIKAG